ncbi:MAG: aromatic amino acid transport family protein, partial [Gammaproteobacteria bacterium]
MPSLLHGTAIIAGAAIGAGMLAMPLASAGMGFAWSLLYLAVTVFFLLHAALLLLETNLNFAPGASFDTFVGETLGPRWKMLNNLALLFVLYVLCYAFTSGGGSALSGFLASAAGITVDPRLAGLIFCAAHALAVFAGSRAVGNVAGVVLFGMIAAFIASVWLLSVELQPALLFDAKPADAVYGLAALPVFLAAFGFHGNVPSLVKYYGAEPGRIVRCLWVGCLVALATYLVWQTAILGQVSREALHAVLAAGGNVGTLVAAVDGDAGGAVLPVLGLFANLALVSSFLSGSLGLFDYLADRFGFADDRRGRAKTTLITFGPPALASALWPDGFLVAIGYAGLAGTVFAVIVPAFAARAVRRQRGSPRFRLWGGDALIFGVLAYGLTVIA